MLTLALVALAVFASFMFVVAVAGWFASERFLRVTEEPYALKLHVLAVTENSVSLPLTQETTRAGIYGVTWQDGYAIVGEVVSSDAGTVTRRLIQTTRPLAKGLSVQWNMFVHKGDPRGMVGLEYVDMNIPSELGPLPAWLVPANRTTSVLLVHGFRATREEGLRILPALHQMDLPVLLLTYRNDAGAPLSPDRYHHLGDTEWKDLEACVRAALAGGANNVVLYGWSMGGCIIETFLQRSADASSVRAVVLDSPVLDWLKSMDAQVRRLHVPSWFTYVLAWFVSRKAKFAFSALNHMHRAPDRTVPTLVFHGIEDALVPIESSDTFVRSRQDLIVFRRVDGADHTQSWNVNPGDYEETVRAFLSDTTTATSRTDAQVG